jgi:cytosine/adenosine deaminase-related metal-dependent hydrolase
VSDLLLKGGKALVGLDSTPLYRDVLICDGKIVSIAQCGELNQFENSARVIDARGKLIIPGFVNAHYHSHDVLARGMFEDIPLEAWIALAILPPSRPLTAREVRLRTLLGAIDCLRNGITTVQDMLGCGPGAEEHVAAAMRAYDEVGIRCVLSLQVGNRAAIDCLPGFRADLPSDLTPLFSASSPEVGRVLDFVEAPLAQKPQDRLHWAIAPGSPQRCTLELLTGLGELARKYGLPVLTHVNESKLQVYLARDLYAQYGGSVLDYLAAAGVLNSSLCMAHGIWFSPLEIERIARANAAVATNPTSNLKLKNGVAPLRMLKHAGVRLALGCDNTSAGDAQNMFEAMKLVCNLNAGKGTQPSGLLAEDSFRIATIGGAEALGLAQQIGTIDIGKKADLTLLDLSDPSYLPLNNAVRQIVYCETGRGVHSVIVDGKVVIDNREIKTVDYASLLEEVVELGNICAADYNAHVTRLTPALPYLLDVVRKHGEMELDFNRWPGSGDSLPLRR